MGPNVYKIDYDNVPVEKQTDPRFIILVDSIQQKLSDPKEIEAICVHEAAHAVFQELAGRSNFTFSGPKITYDSKTDTFDYSGASLQSSESNTEYLKTINIAQRITATAMSFVGAGVAVQELTGRSDFGDSVDRVNFTNAFRLLHNQVPQLFPDGLDLDDLWTKAGERAREYVQKPDIRQAILSTVEKIRDSIFVKL
jgi:hypothetical protein